MLRGKMRISVIIIIAVFLPFCYAMDYTCGDGICDLNENQFSCPADCNAQIIDNYCNSDKDSICDPDCIGDDPDCIDFNGPGVNGNKKNTIFLIVSGLILALLTFFAVIIFKRIHVQKTESDRQIYDINTIEKFSNLKKEGDDSWATKTEADIVESIENDEKYKEYFQRE